MIDNRHLPEIQRYIESKVPRFDIINYLIEKNNFVNYLEIGVFMGDNIRKIKIEHKDGVDTGSEGFLIPEVNYPVTSDDFFNFIKNEDIKYDIIFIDGLHYSYQVDKDIENSLKHIVDNGFILVHDCNPLYYDMQLIPRQTIVWNGDVWKSIIRLKTTRNDLTISVVDTDMGIGIIRKQSSHKLIESYDTIINNWEYFDTNRKRLLNLITTMEFFNSY